MLTVACVYKANPQSGFSPEYIYRLRHMVAQHLPLPHNFVCYTDERLDDVLTRALVPGWHGWLNKCSLWRVPSDGDILYFDLDTVILGDISWLAQRPQFTMLNDLGRELSEWRLQSGMMYLTPEARTLLNSRWDEKRFRQMGGDGQWMHSVVMRSECERFQDVAPGQVCSYKYDVCRKWNGKIPSDVRVVCFHGRPRPHEVDWNPTRVWNEQFQVIDTTRAHSHVNVRANPRR